MTIIKFMKGSFQIFTQIFIKFEKKSSIMLEFFYFFGFDDPPVLDFFISNKLAGASLRSARSARSLEGLYVMYFLVIHGSFIGGLGSVWGSYGGHRGSFI